MKKASKTTVWVLTSEYNEHDQFGEYFVTVFAEKPTVRTLAEYMATNEQVSVGINIMDAYAFIEHLLAGGGRRGTENSWYNLKEVEALQNVRT